MRFITAPLVLALCIQGVRAQEEEAKDEKAPKLPPIRIEKVRVGFLRYDVDELGSPYSKPGMFAPVRVIVGVGDKPIQKGKLLLETSDSEAERTITTQEFQNLPAKTKTVFQGIVMPGNMGADIKATIEGDGRSHEVDAGGFDGRLKLHAQLILTLGSRIPDLRTALMQMTPLRNQNDPQDTTTDPRFAAYEDNVDALPNQWIGYQAVDLMILTTKSNVFLKPLLEPAGHDRLRAIAQWVRRGGRLVVSVSWENQEKVANLLKQAAWQPPIPVQLAENPGNVRANPLESLPELQIWSKSNDPFVSRDLKKRGIPIAQLTTKDPRSLDWTILLETSKEEGSRPLITRIPYGLGSITLVAVALDEPPFNVWKGRIDFWKRLVAECAPRAPKIDENQVQFGRRGWRDPGMPGTEDLASGLHRRLDNFDVKIVPFGWVALFILLYIVVVGPLDYVLLKFVFKRLEWTWITFPVVVFAVSFAAYFTAYAIKGKELRINQVDVIDFDLRTQLDAKQQPAKAYVYGQSFFTLLSPHIQNYTVGLEPNPAIWGQTVKGPLSADSLSWMGKAEDEYLGIGSNARQSLFRRPYYFAEDAVGLKGVPIPVWTTKCFTATWDATLPQLPLSADLIYHREDERRNDQALITGKLQNNLAVDLEDIWIFYRDKAYPVAQLLPGKKAMEKSISIQPFQVKTAQEWASAPDGVDQSTHRTTSDKGEYNPTSLVKQILFFEKCDVTLGLRDNRLRTLDESWRLVPEDNARYSGLREAILFARLKYRAGEGEALYGDEANPLPTRIWLGDLPGRQGASRPALHGTLNHDTYIRVLVPVRPMQ